jgi:hypothetical protein
MPGILGHISPFTYCLESLCPGIPGTSLGGLTAAGDVGVIGSVLVGHFGRLWRSGRKTITIASSSLREVLNFCSYRDGLERQILTRRLSKLECSCALVVIVWGRKIVDGWAIDERWKVER